jgi:cytochrome c oxidase cbb3-type subunit 3
MVYLFIATGKAKVPSQKGTSGEETTGHVWDDDLEELNNPMPRWWLWLFYGTVIFSVIYLVLFPGLGRYEGALGWSSEGQYEQQMARASAAFNERFGELAARPLPELANNEDALRMGRNLYAHNCSTCHASDARGAQGYPNLTDDHWTWGSQPEQILTSIHQGRRAAMPGFGAVLDDEAVTRTATYVQQLAGETVDSSMAAAGKQHYDMVCSACHGVDGKGNALLGAPNLTAGIYIYGSDRDTIEYTIRNGRNGIMPAQADLLGEARTRLVAAYVLNLANEAAAGND